LVVAVCGTLGLAACSSDDSKSSTATPPATSAGPSATTVASGAPATTAPTAGGASSKPFKVMVTGDFTSTIAYTVPEIVPAVKGVLKTVPQATVLTCDTKGDANAATACERKAVDEGVAAVINGFGAIAQDSSILDKAGIPILGYANEKGPTAIALASSLGGYMGIGVALGNAGCKQLGVLELDGTDQLADAITKGFKSTGGTEVARAGIAANAPDLAPAVSKLLGANAQCIALSVTPPQLIQAATAVSQTGKKPLLGGPAAIFFPQIIKALGPLAEGILITDNVEAPSANTPGMNALKADQASIDPKAAVTSFSMYGWISAKMIVAALPMVSGDVTKDSLLAALNKIKDLDVMGVARPITVATLTNPTLAHYVNHYTAAFIIKNGVPTRSSDFIDIGPVIDAP
jgi:hypothetical protein